MDGEVVTVEHAVSAERIPDPILKGPDYEIAGKDIEYRLSYNSVLKTNLDKIEWHLDGKLISTPGTKNYVQKINNNTPGEYKLSVKFVYPEWSYTRVIEKTIRVVQKPVISLTSHQISDRYDAEEWYEFLFGPIDNNLLSFSKTVITSFKIGEGYYEPKEFEEGRNLIWVGSNKFKILLDFDTFYGIRLIFSQGDNIISSDEIVMQTKPKRFKIGYENIISPVFYIIVDHIDKRSPLSFHSIVFDFTNKDNPSHSWKMMGNIDLLGTGWSTEPIQKSLFMNGLPEGSYRLRVSTHSKPDGYYDPVTGEGLIHAREADMVVTDGQISYFQTID